MIGLVVIEMASFVKKMAFNPLDLKLESMKEFKWLALDKFFQHAKCGMSFMIFT